MSPTKIEWTDEVWNPVTGCTKVSQGCRNCYAERMAKRLVGRHGYPSDEPFRVTCRPERLEEPLRWRKPRRVFVCSMGDLFHEDVPDEFIGDVFGAMHEARSHVFQVLTKRPERMRDFILRYSAPGGPLPPHRKNVWLGVSAEDQETADKRIPILLETPAAVRFVSCEPLLGPVDLGLFGTVPHSTPYALGSDRLHWVIAGGESGPGARPMHPDWARSLRDQCKAAEVPFFFKQMSKRDSIPDDLMIREFPHAER